MNETLHKTSSDAVHSRLALLSRDDTADVWLEQLTAAGVDDIPLPAGGATLERWRTLALVAEFNLCLAKLFEGHTDALAVLCELGEVLPNRGTRWGLWAAEAPGARVMIEGERQGTVCLRGKKSWCSGAGEVTHGLLTAWRPDSNAPQLVAVDMKQPGISVNDSHWHAVGMRGSTSVTVSFSDVVAQTVGAEGDYLNRAGFWHGGAGIAACWYGGARFLARRLHASISSNGNGVQNAFRLATLGTVDTALSDTAALLCHAAQWIDANPYADAHAWALRVRASAERSAALVLSEVGRAMGATPFCRDAKFAHMAADLPVYLRQSHAERDLAALGTEVLAMVDPWGL